jgi:DNA repair protein RadC
MKKTPAAEGTAKPAAKRKTTSTRAKATPQTDEQRLRAAVKPYISQRRLQHLMTFNPQELREALLTDPAPIEVQAMLALLSALLRPDERTQVWRAADVAALLLVEMSSLAQEQVRVVCLDAKHHIQTIQTVYQGTLYTTGVRLVEIFREPFRRNSAGIIIVHNHPSGDVTPSQSDLMFTRQASTVGSLLDIPVLDHIIIGRGTWINMGAEYPLYEG